MKESPTTNLLTKIDIMHDAIYKGIRSCLRTIQKESPGLAWKAVRALERFAEIKIVQEITLALCIFIITFAGFNRSARYFATTDALPNNFTTLNILFHHRLDLTNLKPLLDKKDLKGIYTMNPDGLIYPKTSVFLGIAGVPFFAFMNWWWDVPKLDNNTLIESLYSQYFGKIYASFLSSLSAILMYYIYRKLKLSKGLSMGLSLIYAFCTNVFNIAAQSNIQHAISLVLVTLALAFFLSAPKKIWHILVAGAIIGISTHIRISNGFYAIFFSLCIAQSLVVWKPFRLKFERVTFQRIIALLSGLALAYLPGVLFIRSLHIPNGYLDEIQFSLKTWDVHIFAQNVWALLFSYNYGLFVFSPIFILILIAIFTRRKTAPEHSQLLIPATLTILTFIAFAGSWWMWSGGLSLGARLIIEAIPLGMILIGIWYRSLEKLPVFKFQLFTLILISIYFNILTSFTFDKSWHDEFTKPGHEAQLRNAWYTEPALLVNMMQHQFYFDEQLQRDERNGKTVIKVRRTRYWFSGYDHKLERKSRYTLQILPLPE